MKKLIAVLLTATMLITASAMILAEETNSSSETQSQVEVTPTLAVTPTVEVTKPTGPRVQKDKFENILVTRAEDREKLQEQFQDLKAKIEEKRAMITEKKASFATKHDEFKEFKGLLFDLKDKMLTLKKEGNALHAANAKLAGDLRNSLETIEEKGIVLSDETKLQLDESAAEIKALTTSIKETKGQIHTIIMNNKEFIKTKDYVSMETAFNEIYVIEQFRNDSLTQINTLLQDMIKLLVTVV